MNENCRKVVKISKKVYTKYWQDISYRLMFCFITGITGKQQDLLQREKSLLREMKEGGILL